MRIDLAEKPIDVGKRDPINITASFGIAELDLDVSIEDSIEHADRAMYAAKASDRNCTHIWAPS